MAEKGLDRFPQVTVQSRAEWRAWLEANHLTSGPIWLVTFKKADPERYLPWSDIVDEALCFGWIDSVPRKLDEKRTMLMISPRKPKSVWSKVNQDKVARLIEEGRMTPAGLAKVELAQANGSWDALDEVNTLAEPEDLLEALRSAGEAEGYWNRFPPSVRRGILQWIAAAKRPETRYARIKKTTEAASLNIRIGQR